MTSETITTSDNRKSVLLIGEQLGNDTSTHREVCPKCGGGDSKEKAFAVSKDQAGYIYWRCFRASCGYSGSTGGGGKGQRTVSRVSIPLSAPLVGLTEGQCDYFIDEYGVDALGNILFCPDKEAFAFKVHSYSGTRLGYHLRWFDGRKQKADSYPDKRTEPFMAFYIAPNNGALVVVEDCLSALKVAQSGISSVSLLGTNLDWERVFKIREGYPKMVLALDRGTLPLALVYKDKFQHLFEDITIWNLDKDLKYVEKRRIVRAAKGQTDFITNP